MKKRYELIQPSLNQLKHELRHNMNSKRRRQHQKRREARMSKGSRRSTVPVNGTTSASSQEQLIQQQINLDEDFDMIS